MPTDPAPNTSLVDQDPTNPFVWVKDTETGAHYAVRKSAVDKDRHEVTDRPAVDRNGDPLPGKPNVRAQRRSASSQAPTTTEEK